MVQRVQCVAAILQNSEQEVLLQQRDNTPGMPYAGYWTLPGGSVEDGETPDEAVHRELLEEIELDVPVKLWQVYERPGPNGMEIVQHVFTGRINRIISCLAINEGQALRYVNLSDLQELSIAYGFDELLREYFGRAGEEAISQLPPIA